MMDVDIPDDNSICIKINVEGELEYTNATHIRQALTRGIYRLVELYDYDEEDYICIYGQELGNDRFNNFEFERGNYRGDVYIMRFNYRTQQLIYLSIEEFLNMYNIEEDIDYSEEETTEDSYDYDDGFLVRD